MSMHAHDQQAEQALLGAMIIAPLPTWESFSAVPSEAYYATRHQVVASVLRDMMARRIPIDHVTLLAEINNLGIAAKIGEAPYIHTLIASCVTPVNAGWYADRVCELFARRTLADNLTRESQRLDAAWDGGEPTAAADAVIRLRNVLDDVTNYTACAGGVQPMYLDEFLDMDLPRNWLVPGLIEKAERLILTGDEGFGKTELAIQIALCCAGGIHPFTGTVLPSGPLRVAVVDCENPKGLSQRRFRKIVGAVQATRINRQAGYIDFSKQLAVEFRTDELDLFNGSDVAWLERYVAATTPDILLIGPLYKLHHEDENSSMAARLITSVIDGIRARHGCAVITEAHAGHAKNSEGLRFMRPRGSALFLGWPEFGLGLRRSANDPDAVADVVSWRGAREERDWPKSLFKAASETSLPWLPDEDYRAMEMEAY